MCVLSFKKVFCLMIVNGRSIALRVVLGPILGDTRYFSWGGDGSIRLIYLELNVGRLDHALFASCWRIYRAVKGFDA
jgi:hypothetical protein